MNKQIFVDSDIILDLLGKREPFYRFAAEVCTLADTGEVELVTTSLVIANVYYLLRKAKGNDTARELLRKLRMIIGVVPITEHTVDLALNSHFSDFEDALQYYTALECGIPILLTRNVRDYTEKGLVVQTAEEYLKGMDSL